MQFFILEDPLFSPKANHHVVRPELYSIEVDEGQPLSSTKSPQNGISIKNPLLVSMANTPLPTTLLVLSAAFLLLGALVATESGGQRKLDPASTNYVVLDRNHRTGQERFFCLARGRCHFRTIQCPVQCPQRKPKKNRVVKGCFADCSSRCETVCKLRKPNCNGYGSICYDPRFVGGDGTMFYFHGTAGGDFALVSDRDLHINAHFIGTRPAGRSRDFTWVQALAVMFDSHALVVGARRVAEWDAAEDGLYLQWDGVPVELPSNEEAEWRVTAGGREVAVERTAEANSVRVAVAGLVEMDLKVVPVGEADNRTHGYGIPEGDAFAHLEMQFRFVGGLSDDVEGVLGKTYRPGYESPVKRGVAMPMMGGEDRYRTPGFMSPRCRSCLFRPEDGIAGEGASAGGVRRDE